MSYIKNLNEEEKKRKKKKEKNLEEHKCYKCKWGNKITQVCLFPKCVENKF